MLRPPEKRQRRANLSGPGHGQYRKQRVKPLRIHQREIDRHEALMDAEHHRQQEQAGQNRRSERVTVKVQKQP